MTSVKFFTYKDLVRINEMSKKLILNRTLSDEFIADLNKVYRYPITQLWDHNDHVRVRFIYNVNGDAAYLDMTWKQYDALPVFHTDAA